MIEELKQLHHTVMCFGTFDVLHLGHLDYFQQAKRHGDYLIVVIARDKTKHAQKKETIFDEQERLELVKSLKIVNEAVLGNPGDHFKIILEKKPAAVMLGYDHKIKEREVAERLSAHGFFPAIYRAKPYKPHQHKSTKIKEIILKRK